MFTNNLFIDSNMKLIKKRTLYQQLIVEDSLCYGVASGAGGLNCITRIMKSEDYQGILNWNVLHSVRELGLTWRLRVLQQSESSKHPSKSKQDWLHWFKLKGFDYMYLVHFHLFLKILYKLCKKLKGANNSNQNCKSVLSAIKMCSNVRISLLGAFKWKSRSCALKHAFIWNCFLSVASQYRDLQLPPIFSARFCNSLTEYNKWMQLVLGLDQDYETCWGLMEFVGTLLCSKTLILPAGDFQISFIGPFVYQ